MRILRALADGELHSAKSLSEEEEIPQQFAYKILKKLSRARLVESVRGGEGGYQLTGDLRLTTLYDLIEGMEAEKQVISCLRPGYKCEWEQGHSRRCAIHRNLAGIQEMLDEKLRTYTLHSLMFKEK